MNQSNKSGGQLQGVLAILVLVASTTFFFIPVLFVGLLKLFPHFQWRIYCTRLIDNIIAFWCDTNNAYINRTQRIRWEVQGIESLNPKGWHLLVANHQSWLDIVILQRLFNRKIPMLKFFIKDQLKWVPLLGFAWWAMGSPFMKRYSKDYLLKNPEKKGKDLEATRKALELFKHTPSTIMNFVEGTRFTSAKKESQQSPYLHLLKPKSGGISFVISAMSEHIQNFLDVTIIYPDNHSLWDFLCHRIKAITVHVREIPIPGKFRNTQLIENEEIKLEFRDWLNEQWAEKDALIKSLQ